MNIKAVALSALLLPLALSTVSEATPKGHHKPKTPPKTQPQTPHKQNQGQGQGQGQGQNQGQGQDQAQDQIQGQGQHQGQGQDQKAYGGNAESKSNSAAGAAAFSGSKVDSDIENHNANIGIQGQKTDVDTDVRNANVQGQAAIQGQKTDASSENANGNLNANGNANLIDASHSDSSTYDGRSETIIYPDQVQQASSVGTSLKFQTLMCLPDGQVVVLEDGAQAPEQRDSFGLGVNISFVGGGFINHQRAGRLHKSQLPTVQTAIKGAHEARIARLSRLGSNPLAQTMMSWNMADRHTVGVKGGKAIEEAQAKAATELATYAEYVANGGDPDITGCNSSSTPVEFEEPEASLPVPFVPEIDDSEIAPGPVRGRW